jgi:hypothetical protein
VRVGLERGGIQITEPARFQCLTPHGTREPARFQCLTPHGTRKCGSPIEMDEGGADLVTWVGGEHVGRYTRRLLSFSLLDIVGHTIWNMPAVRET